MNEESSNVIDFRGLQARAHQERMLEAVPLTPPLHGGGGGGTFDGMEARVARLEADVGHIKADIGDIKDSLKDVNGHVSEARVTIATLVERVAHLPTKAYIGTAVTAGTAAVITGLALLSHFGWLVAGPPTH